MQSTWLLSRTTVLIVVLGFTSASSIAATNECDAQVVHTSIISKGGQARIAFDVKTTCAASQGQFEYSYHSSERPGGPYVRKVPMWNASKGKAFTWSDEFRDGSNITNVTVRPATIESKKM